MRGEEGEKWGREGGADREKREWGESDGRGEEGEWGVGGEER